MSISSDSHRPVDTSHFFETAMSTVTKLKEAEKMRKGEELRLKTYLSECRMNLQRMESSWHRIVSHLRQQHDANANNSKVHTDPSMFDDSFDAMPLYQQADFVAKRLDRIADEASSTVVLCASQQQRLELVKPPSVSPPLSPRSAMLSASLHGGGSPSKRSGAAVVTVVDDGLSPAGSMSFSPRVGARRSSSFGASESVFFVPDQAFQPDGNNKVSRGTMTAFSRHASTSAQTTGEVASHCSTAEFDEMKKYVALLETKFSPEELIAFKLQQLTL